MSRIASLGLAVRATDCYGEGTKGNCLIAYSTNFPPFLSRHSQQQGKLEQNESIPPKQESSTMWQKLLLISISKGQSFILK